MFHNLRQRFLILVASMFALTLPGHAAKPAAVPIDGTVQRVVDGDSLWVEPAAGGEPMQLRLLGIDAPEICQPWGPEAQQALRELVLGKLVSVRVSGRDTYGRTLGTLYLGSLNVNKSLVQEGHAWSTRYKYDRGPYVADERMAKALSRGLNSIGGAVPPWEFRRAHGHCNGEVAAGSIPSIAATVPAPAAAPTSPASAVAAYRCDGRTYCSQMRSCAEATWFLRHCPGVKMDGNHDGVPCEKQWCN